MDAAALLPEQVALEPVAAVHHGPDRVDGGDGAPPVVEEPLAPYLDSTEHVREELARIDLLVAAQTLRWRTTSAAACIPVPCARSFS